MQVSDWAEAATAVGTLVLAVATFSSVRSGNRQGRNAERALNADASLSIEVSRSNLNYLLMHPHSLYAAYHIPTSSLRICPAEAVLHQYEHAEKTGPTSNRSLSILLTS